MASIDIKGILDKRNKNMLIIDGRKDDIYKEEENYIFNIKSENEIYEEEENYIFNIKSENEIYEILDIENNTKLLRKNKELKSNKKDKNKKIKNEKEVKGNQWLYESIKTKVKLININEDIYFYNKEFGYYELIKDARLGSFIRQNVSDEQKKYINRTIISETIAWIKADNKIEIDTKINEIDPVRYINFKDCIYDIYYDRTLSHSEKYIFTSYIDCNYLSHSGNTENFSKYLRDSFGDDKDSWKQIQELLGVTISNYRSFKKAFFLLGPPNSGKSTLLDLLTELVGRKFCSNVSLHDLNEKFRTSSLKDKKLNVVGETSEINLNRLDTFKSLTGNDVIQVEFKGKDPVELKNKALMVFAGNSLPKLKVEDSNGAFFNRINVIVFQNRRSAKDINYNLFDNLIEEKEGIIKFAINGLRRLIRNNFDFSESDLSKSIKNNQYKKENSFQLFLREKCKLKIDSKISVKDLINEYYNYCEKKCVNIITQSDINAILRGMENIKRKKMRINGVSVNGIEGIQIID